MAESKRERPVAWVWDWVDGEWKQDSQRGDLSPGRIVLVDAAFGGYGPNGWDPESRPAIPVSAGTSTLQDKADDAQEREDLSESRWKTIATHGAEVGSLAQKLATTIGLGEGLSGLLRIAGEHHDHGKAIRFFQGSIRHADRPDRQDLAKAPNPWPGGRKVLYRENAGEGSEHRPGLRHELASMLALFGLLKDYRSDHPALLGGWEGYLEGAINPDEREARGAWTLRILSLQDRASFDLVAYLVLSHHGKVRMRLSATPQDQAYRAQDNGGLPINGVREGDELPALYGNGGELMAPVLRLTLEPAYLGLSDMTGPSWTERAQGLLAAYGPGALAFLEALLRTADIRASRYTTADPLLNEQCEVGK